MSALLRVLVILASLSVLANTVAAAVPQRSDEALRKLFVEAEAALQRKDRQGFERRLAELRDYPLHPYLVHAELDARLSSASTAEVDRFLRDHEGSLLADRLRSAWLDRLAREKRWREFLAYQTNDASPAAACLRRRALLETGQRDQALEDLDAFWLTGRSLPNACDPVFDAWRKSGRLTADLAWGRFRLALEQSQTALAGFLRRDLPAAERAWADRWLELHHDPERLSQVKWDARAHAMAGTALTHGLVRLSRRDPALAAQIWDARGAGFRLTPQDRAVVEREIALRLAVRGHPDALGRLEKLPAQAFDAQLRQWQVRAGLAAQDWSAVAAAVAAMDDQTRSEEGWRYWQARALEASGHAASARELFAQVADERNFYGFLAADRLGRPYRIAHRATNPAVWRVEILEQKPGMRRARELLHLGRTTEARREWDYVLRQLDAADMEAAALLAAIWGWHDRAIFTAARARQFDDIDLRFPIAHENLVRTEASRQGLNPAWPFAILRQESAFMQDARSSAGALGLMQLMPATGRAMARHVGLSVSNPRELLDPARNIRIGTYYLRRNLDEFEGHAMLATAAYNAGAARVRSWLPTDGEVPADVWAELIPFGETREYVRRVFAYKVLYELRLSRDPTPLSVNMAPVAMRGSIGQARTAHLEALSDPGNAAICDAPGYAEGPCS
ncbi:MAG: transglycosylase SLT domain-containing protein [Ectothiorhodospiraceae bacterium]|jgi:soluble lytic murein transglycosylase|nr:transglycosylase SLT domain-containing protein [Ectothiorhodospiraceae bacterium]